MTQLARTIATALGLNGDLTESLALVHDIGHPPFGHAGEHALDEAMRAHGLRFDHNLHALRIVTAFEQRYVAFPGLNLTLGVREGIIKHSRDYDPAEYPELAEYFLDQQPPLEAQLIDLADEIAYLAADFDDGFSSGILDLSHVRAHVALFERYYAPMALDYPDAAPERLIDESLKRMLNALTSDLITRSGEAVAQAGITSLAQVRGAAAPPHPALGRDGSACAARLSNISARICMRATQSRQSTSALTRSSLRCMSAGCAIHRCCRPTARPPPRRRVLPAQSPITSPA